MIEKLLKLGISDALKQRPIRYISQGLTIKNSGLLKVLFEGGSVDTKSLQSNVVALLKLTQEMPVLFYMDKTADTKYNANKVKEKMLICNNKSWVKGFIDCLDADDTKKEELLSKVLGGLTKADKDFEELALEGKTRGLVVKYTKGSFSGTVKKAPLDLLGLNYQAFPLPYLWGYAIGLYNLGKKGLIEIKYRKLDGAERVHYFSANSEIIHEVYADDFAKANEFLDLSVGVFSNERKLLKLPFNYSIGDGLFSLTELSLSKNSHSLKRNISLTTISSVRQLLGKELEDKKAELAELVSSDIENVALNFEKYALKGLSKECDLTLRETFNLQADLTLVEAVNVKVSLETTTFKIALHKFMLANADKWFEGYTGKIGLDDALLHLAKQHSVVSVNEIDDLDLPF